jgi:predicted dithiol-disulfide oxidoreductase (DUF899 family)
MIADALNGSVVHLANHDVILAAVSRAPLTRLQAYKQRMGWTFPWASSFGSDFNSDFSVWITEEQQRKGAEYNYRRETPTSDVFRWHDGHEGGDSAEGRLAAACGVDLPAYHRDRPGMSAFVIDDGAVHLTYSTHARIEERRETGLCRRTPAVCPRQPRRHAPHAVRHRCGRPSRKSTQSISSSTEVAPEIRTGSSPLERP